MAKYYVCVGQQGVIVSAEDPLTAAERSLESFLNKRDNQLIYVDERGARTRYAHHRYVLERNWDGEGWWRVRAQ